MTPNPLIQWAIDHNVTSAALADLTRRLTVDTWSPGDRPQSETAASAEIRLEASSVGARLWRNNVGAGEINGRFMRWGLANDSHAVNDVLKSADLIGIRPRLITQAMVGQTIGQFLSREVKAPGWSYTGTPRELAQVQWATLVTLLGGDAAIVTGRGSL